MSESNLNIAITIPPIKTEFLKELMDILGKPTEVYVRVWHNREKLDDIILSEGFAERICYFDNLDKIIKIYDNNFKNSKRNRIYRIEKIVWNKFKTEYGDTSLITLRALRAEFTPYNFNLEIDVNNINYKEINSLFNAIIKYKVKNNIKFIF